MFDAGIMCLDEVTHLLTHYPRKKKYDSRQNHRSNGTHSHTRSELSSSEPLSQPIDVLFSFSGTKHREVEHPTNKEMKGCPVGDGWQKKKKEDSTEAGTAHSHAVTIDNIFGDAHPLTRVPSNGHMD